MPVGFTVYWMRVSFQLDPMLDQFSGQEPEWSKFKICVVAIDLVSGMSRRCTDYKGIKESRLGHGSNLDDNRKRNFANFRESIHLQSSRIEF